MVAEAPCKRCETNLTGQAWMNGSAWVDQACSELAGGRIREFSLLVATNPSSLDGSVDAEIES